MMNTALCGVDDLTTKVEWMRTHRGTSERWLSLVRTWNTNGFIRGEFEVGGQGQTFWGTRKTRQGG